MERRAQIKAWIEDVLDRTGWSPEEWARKAAGAGGKVSSTTITRFLKHPDAPLLTSTTIGKLERVAPVEFVPSHYGSAPKRMAFSHPSQSEPEKRGRDRRADKSKRNPALPPDQNVLSIDEQPLRDVAMVRELDARAAAGANGSLIEINKNNEDEHVVGLYGFPLAGFRENYGALPEEVRILQVIGDSMIPTLWPGQRVMVNLKDRIPSPPGIFVLWDGIGLVIKRIEHVAHSDPAIVRIISDNAKYSAYERAVDEAHLCGRVIGAWGRL